jgi:hypothetical protein
VYRKVIELDNSVGPSVTGRISMKARISFGRFEIVSTQAEKACPIFIHQFFCCFTPPFSLGFKGNIKLILVENDYDN